MAELGGGVVGAVGSDAATGRVVHRKEASITSGKYWN
jgi:hypothetical protein